MGLARTADAKVFGGYRTSGSLENTDHRRWFGHLVNGNLGRLDGEIDRRSMDGGRSNLRLGSWRGLASVCSTMEPLHSKYFLKVK